MFHGRTIDDFSMITVDSTTGDNHESTVSTGTNVLDNHTRAHTNLYSGQVGGGFGLFGNSINTGNIVANISGTNCDLKSSVDDELFSNCDTKEKVEDVKNSNCDTFLVEDESVRLSGKNSIPVGCYLP